MTERAAMLTDVQPARQRSLPLRIRRSILENLSMLISAGVDPSSALSATMEGVSARVAVRRMQRARHEVDGGLPLWSALTQQGVDGASIVACACG